MLWGDTIRLRGVERTDLPALVGWLNDPALRRQLSHTGPLSMAQEERWFEALLGSRVERVFLIEAKLGRPVSWRPVGACGLHGIDWLHRTATVGIFLGAESARGRGWGGDATATVARHAFDDLGLHRLELEVFCDNPRAIRCYARVGFVDEGVRRQGLFKDGAHRDLTRMGLLRSDLRADVRADRRRDQATATPRPPTRRAPRTR